ncbi:GNAT family N-acetyltransferase [Rhodococcus sp. Z13]|uniref:GNAT family N-acetyltransferase n=1 Tax=Rhodococcus sacchari TaxID=2962047 RepID=A0ACD4DE05_9NOCA|nr:GNAT family N-acetyltransferase [Rhodococcus sp. Z13]UYP18293.1 GNAT family N-acetyltransferase [Rhodococcus sp. Z13]
MSPERPAAPIPLGTRVVLRHRLPAGYSHPMTDVIGELVSLEPVVAVRTADGRVMQVAPGSVVALKALSARPIRVTEIRALEHAAAAGRPGLELDWVDGWLVRSGGGAGGDTDSATPLGERGTVADPADPEVRARLRAWFAARGLPLRLRVPDRLARVPADWPASASLLVMGADLQNVPLPPGQTPVTIGDGPDADWLALHRGGEAARGVLRTVAGGTLGFGRIGAPGRTPLAIGRAAITDAPDGRRWVGLSDLEVAPEHRRQGLGTLVCGALLRWARERGATHAYLQVDEDDTATRALGRGLGFIDHHRCRYVTEPVG